MSELVNNFTSTGVKLFAHQEAMANLRNGKGTPISAWCAPTDICNARCGFCSVGNRPQDVLPWSTVKGFLDQLIPLGLKSIVWSGGGNFLLWKCKETGKTANDIIEYTHGQGVECALITNGMPLVDYGGRKSWKNLSPENLDRLTWCRISMAGLDYNHKEQEVYVPDFDHGKTALGFSWIMSDLYEEPTHKHGWVSTPEDVQPFHKKFNPGSPEDTRPLPPCPECASREYGSWDYWKKYANGIAQCKYCGTRFTEEGRRIVFATDRLPWIEEQVAHYVEDYNPRYVRLLANCLQPEMISERHEKLDAIAKRINPHVVFSQFKPPENPVKPCAKVYTRPCLNADGWVYPCDSVVLNRTAGHKFGSAWRVCRWDEIGELFQNPIRKVIPENICPGCVFSNQVNLIGEIIEGRETPVPTEPIEHVNYI